MNQIQQNLRPATKQDADYLIEFVNVAGEGLPEYLWTQLAEPGQTVWDVGRARACRETGSFSYRNAYLLIAEKEIAACLIGYPLADSPADTDYSTIPAMFVPMQELEDMVPGTWYVNVIATLAVHRGHGYASKLLRFAEKLAIEQNKKGLSLIVADSNEAARGLYTHLGFKEIARRAMVKEQWQNSGKEWVLMVKKL